jgi:DUF4097 and DUF4098 domain-containing protein YvlB
MKMLNILAMLSLLGAAGYAADEPQERTKAETFAVEPGGLLRVRLSGGDVTIAAWTKNEVLVSAAGRAELHGKDLTITHSGNTVEIAGDLGPGNEGDLRLTINVPSRFDVELQTQYGDIDIGGPLQGNIRAATSGGDIRLRALSGDVTVSTLGGDIASENVEGTLKATTMGGDLRIGSVTGTLELSTMGGDVTVDRVGREVSVSTSGGDVTLGDAGGSVRVSTAGGDIRVTKAGGAVNLNTAGGDIVVKSAPADVQASTAGGDLNIADAAGPVSASTAGGDVTLSLVSGKIVKSKLSTAHGDVTVYVQEGTKVTVEARIRNSSSGEEDASRYQVKSDFPMQQTSQDEGRSTRATIQVNGGGEVVTIETMAGNISVKRAGAASKTK